MKKERIEEFVRLVPTIKALDNIPKNKRCKDVQAFVYAYLAVILKEIGVYTTCHKIARMPDIVNDSIKLIVETLSDNDQKAYEEVLRLCSMRCAYQKYFITHPALYIYTLNTNHVSEEYLALFHTDDIITRNEGTKEIVSIERDQIVYN